MQDASAKEKSSVELSPNYAAELMDDWSAKSQLFFSRSKEDVFTKQPTWSHLIYHTTMKMLQDTALPVRTQPPCTITAPRL